MKKEDIVQRYPEGLKIRLISMKGEPQMENGLIGTVDYVDDSCQIHMIWENGSTLALNIDTDEFEISEELISVVRVEPLCFPRAVDIDNKLSAMQEAVNGPIEFFYPFKDEDIVFILNEEGKYTQIPNRVLYSDEGDILDIIYGPFIISGIDGQGNLKSLCKTQTDRFMNMFIESELFLEISEGEMIVIKSSQVEMV